MADAAKPDIGADIPAPSAPDAPPEVIDPADEGERQALLARFHPLFSGAGGIDSWLRDGTPQTVVERLGQLDSHPMTREQLNQLLVLSHEAGLSRGFFEYYWLSAPEHTYNVRELAGFQPEYVGSPGIESIEHLRWGLTRFYFDSLLYFGNIRSAYRRMRDMSLDAITTFFRAYR